MNTSCNICGGRPWVIKEPQIAHSRYISDHAQRKIPPELRFVIRTSRCPECDGQGESTE